MKSNRTVQYIDFGIISARQFWNGNVLPAFERFQAQPGPESAIDASVSAWHVHEWLWHEQHPGTDTRQNASYRMFQNNLFSACPELAWVRDVADAGKHRGLGRPTQVRRVTSNTLVHGGPVGWAPVGMSPIGFVSVSTRLIITLTDGSEIEFGPVLSRVIEYWRCNHFP